MLFRHRFATVIAASVEDTCTPTLSMRGASVAVKAVPVLSQHAVLKAVRGIGAPVLLAQ
jgi:hypothetical protein